MKFYLETGPGTEWVHVSARFFGCKQQKLINNLKHQKGNLLEGFQEAQRMARKSRGLEKPLASKNEKTQPPLCPCLSDG